MQGRTDGAVSTGGSHHCSVKAAPGKYLAPFVHSSTYTNLLCSTLACILQASRDARAHTTIHSPGSNDVLRNQIRHLVEPVVSVVDRSNAGTFTQNIITHALNTGRLWYTRLALGLINHYDGSCPKHPSVR